MDLIRAFKTPKGVDIGGQVYLTFTTVADPIVDGDAAPLRTLALNTNNFRLYYKVGTANTDWALVGFLSEAYRDWVVQSAVPTYVEGRTFYLTASRSLRMFTGVSGFSIALGRMFAQLAVNDSGSTVAAGKVVYPVGSDGTNVKFKLAVASAVASALAPCLTVASSTNAATTEIIQRGPVGGLDTSSFTAGVYVYLDQSTAGALTATAPTSGVIIRCGVVLASSATAGVILWDPVVVSTGASGTSSPTKNAQAQYLNTYASAVQLPNWSDSNPLFNDFYGNPTSLNSGYQNALSGFKGALMVPFDVAKVSIVARIRLYNLTGSTQALGTSVTFTVHFIVTSATRRSVVTTATFAVVTPRALNYNEGLQAHEGVLCSADVTLATPIPKGSLVGIALTCPTSWEVIGDLPIHVNYRDS